jgi:hypothetical protein
MPPPLLHQRLLNEATLLGTEGLLQQLPVEYSQALEQAIHQQVRQAVLHYASGLDTLARQLDPFCGESAHMHHPLAKRKRLGYTGRLTIKEEETMTTRNAAEPAAQERQAGDDTAGEAAQKKWTPPADPFGFENKLAGKNRVTSQSLSSRR